MKKYWKSILVMAAVAVVWLLFAVTVTTVTGCTKKVIIHKEILGPDHSMGIIVVPYPVPAPDPMPTEIPGPLPVPMFRIWCEIPGYRWV